MKFAYVYVPARSRSNLEIGLQQEIWGWQSSVLDKKTGRRDAQSLETGDYLIFGHRGPSPRVDSGGWANVTLRRVIVTRMTGPYFVSQEPVWPDHVYPERVRFEVLGDEESVSGPVLGPDAMEAIRLSGTKQGSPVLAGDGALVGIASAPIDDDEAGPWPGGVVLNHEGPTDVLTAAFARREQRKLRKWLVGSADEVTCALCGRQVPQRLIVAAHIKRRSKAAYTERMNLNNVMAVCVLGCDALFEYGYVYVDETGTIRQSRRSWASRDFTAAVGQIVGRQCTAFATASAPFFEHRRSEADT